MSLNEDQQSLLDKYFDESLSEAESAKLQKQISENKEFSDELARRSRLDYALEQSYETNTNIKVDVQFPEKKKESRLFLTVAAVAVLILAGFIAIKTAAESPAPQDEQVAALDPSDNSETPKENEYDGVAMPAGRLLSTGVKSTSTDKGVPETIRYNQHVQPILSDKCFFCHGPDEHERKADLRLDIRDVAIKLKAIVPGKPEESELVKRIMLPHDHEDVMPTEKSHKSLDEVEKQILKKWVAAGANYEEHWAYTPVTRKKGTNIDQYVAARLKREKLKFSKPADARTLTRRLYLDLTGLPPKPEDLPAAGKYYSDAEVEALVDNLLASPHYGERMAVWWLDVVRYSNTIGYHSDVPAPTSSYRDYVIRAFNDNMPYDQFTIEQIAGDLLPDATVDQKVAATYCRLNQQSHEGGVQDLEYVKKYQSERVRTTTTAWMGATLMCAECHDHKFDPYTQKDFYSFAAFFSDILEMGAYTHVGKYNDDIKKYESDTMLFGSLPMSHNKQIGAAMLLPTDEQLKALKAAKNKKEKNNIIKNVRATLAVISAKPREVRVLNRGNWMDKDGEVVLPATPHFLPNFIQSSKDKRLTRLDLAKWIVDKKNPLTARVFANRLWSMFFQNGISSVVNDFGLQGQWPEHPELLDWLAAEFMDVDWNMKHLVKTVVLSKAYRQSCVNFPKLQTKDPANKLLARQTPRRLDAEFIRDNALATSGLLNGELYGEPVYPYQPVGYWKHLKFPNRTYKESTGEDQYRRGIYTHWQRTFLHPMFRSFDAPSRDECAMERAESNTPLQALVLMNDPTFVEAARVLSDKLVEIKDVNERITKAFLAVLSREPETEEIDVLKELLQKERQRIIKNPGIVNEFQSIGQYKSSKTGADLAEVTAFAAVTRVIYNLHESITRY